MPSKPKKANTQVNATKPQPLHNANDAPPPAAISQKAESSPNLAATPNGKTSKSKTEPDVKSGDTTESAGEPTPAPAINRKKQKRREKEAAKRNAEQQSANGHVQDPSIRSEGTPPVRQSRGPTKGYFTEEPDYVDPPDGPYGDIGSPEDAFYSGDDDPNYSQHDGSGAPENSWLNTSKRKKVSKVSRHSQPPSNSLSRTSTALSRPNLPKLSSAALRSAHRMGDQIWNTSTQAERENIKQFWLELGEEERRSLVKVEKEAVLRKMKEQQKHSCSCSVCGRKRTAIEEELEVLYDAYYEELEQFANHNNDLSNGPQIMAPPRSLRRTLQPMAGSYPSRGRVHELGEDDEELDDDEEEYDDDDEPYSEDEEDEIDVHGLPPAPPDFFQFGNSLTVKDGILTVADDLLKNDGKHFIDMMEQLAERRMQRHNHPPIDEDDDYDDEDDDEDYDSQEEDDFEGDEMDSMTEEQRMEEGRRMFQIFAARMFEQRVLTAYREKVAAERQQKLLEELDEENRLDTQREAKKARDAAKKKEKLKQKKQAKEEEKAKREAEKAAQEAEAREIEEKRLEEQRQRKEEQRKKREAERKAAEEERLRKEADKQRRNREEKERQAELERKRQQAKDEERKKREETKKKEREEREAKEQELRDRKAKEEKERKAKEDQARKDKEASVRPEKDTRPATSQALPLRAQAVALPPGLVPPPRGPHIQSPNFQVATPIVPQKVPTPNRTRQPSQPGQQSHGSSPRSQKASTDISRSSASPASVAIPQTPGPGLPAKMAPPLHHPQPSAPRSPLNNHGRGQYPFSNINGLPGLGVTGPPVPGMMQNMMPPMPMYSGPPMGNQPRFAPNGMQYPPGFGGPRPFQPMQPVPYHAQAPVQSLGQQPQNQVPKPPSHSRQTSGSSPTEVGSQQAPIARPGPIARPSSTTPDKQKHKQSSPEADVEQITTQLGSKALLDDADEPMPSTNDTRPIVPPFGPPGSARIPFATSFAEPKQDSFGNPNWGSFNGGMSNGPGWGPPGPHRPNPGWIHQAFGVGGLPQPVQRSHLPRPVGVRLLLVEACRRLASVEGSSNDGNVSHPINKVLWQVNTLKAPQEPVISMEEMLGICDTEGNAQNGGGIFDVIIEDDKGRAIRFQDDATIEPRSSVGDIGSPIPGHSQPASFGGIGQNFGPPGRGF